MHITLTNKISIMKTKATKHRTPENYVVVLRALHLLYREVRALRSQRDAAASAEEVWRDAAYVQEYVGISERTLYRYQEKGLLGEVRKKNGKRQFGQQAIERFKKIYWNL